MYLNISNFIFLKNKFLTIGLVLFLLDILFILFSGNSLFDSFSKLIPFSIENFLSSAFTIWEFPLLNLSFIFLDTISSSLSKLFLIFETIWNLFLSILISVLCFFILTLLFSFSKLLLLFSLGLKFEIITFSVFCFNKFFPTELAFWFIFVWFFKLFLWNDFLRLLLLLFKFLDPFSSFPIKSEFLLNFVGV